MVDRSVAGGKRSGRREESELLPKVRACFSTSHILYPIPPTELTFTSSGMGVSTAESFLLGAASACTAVTVTNPFEVIKTRMQLHGELGGKGQYQSPFKVFGRTFALEGVRGIQRGLGAVSLSLRLAMEMECGWR